MRWRVRARLGERQVWLTPWTRTGESEYGAAMEFRGRDLLSDEARFLADYCGEDAVRRWRARLSDEERDQLTSFVAFVQEVCRSLGETIRRVLQAVLDAFASLMQSLVEMIVVLITGRSPDSFGHQTP